MTLSDRVERDWYLGASWLKLLRPIEWLYRLVVAGRRLHISHHPERRYRAPVPVIIVGNITVGGTGKSPMTAWLVDYLKEQGWHPGIVSRGYGGHAASYPARVYPESDPREMGDEPVMLAAQTRVPVVIDPNRANAARALVELECDILLSDDGLQHYRLERDLELVVIDGSRGLGNGRCLPEGPLREPVDRLNSVDAIIFNGATSDEIIAHNVFRSYLRPQHYRRLSDDACFPLVPSPLSDPVHAIAGIGHPERFFTTLEALGILAKTHAFSDHHGFTPADIAFNDSGSVVMTAKDAVKCRAFATDRMWSLDVNLVPDQAFIDWLSQRLKTLRQTHFN